MIISFYLLIKTHPIFEVQILFYTMGDDINRYNIDLNIYL